MTEPILMKTKGDGLKIQVAVWEGDGKQILCIHGLTANCRCWDLIASTLTPHHRLIAMDLRGRGLSDRPPSGYSVQHHCNDILALMDDMGLNRAILTGHSLGALISLAFAAQYPLKVEKLILVDGGGKLSEEQLAKALVGIKPSLDRLGQIFSSFESYVSILKQAPFLKPWNQFLETYFLYDVEKVEGGLRSRVQPEHIQEEILNMKDVDASEYYPKTSSPALILRTTKGLLAEDDLVLPKDVAKRMIREMPKAECIDLEETNHYSILFQPNEKRDRAILKFLEKD